MLPKILINFIKYEFSIVVAIYTIFLNTAIIYTLSILSVVFILFH